MGDAAGSLSALAVSMPPARAVFTATAISIAVAISNVPATSAPSNGVAVFVMPFPTKTSGVS